MAGWVSDKEPVVRLPLRSLGGDLGFTKNGFGCLQQINSRMNIHAKSKKHLDNCLSLKMLGATELRTQNLSIAEHNAGVSKLLLREFRVGDSAWQR